MVSQDTISLRSNGDIQELLTLLNHPSSPSVFTWDSCYLIFSFICVFCRSLLSFCSFFFCVVCSSSILIPLWYLKVLLDMLVSLFNWTTGMNKIQLKKNRNDNVGIKWPPYATMFGCAAEIGLLKTPIPNEILQVLQKEED